jgi:hypothetical protein
VIAPKLLAAYAILLGTVAALVVAWTPAAGADPACVVAAQYEAPGFTAHGIDCNSVRKVVLRVTAGAGEHSGVVFADRLGFPWPDTLPTDELLTRRSDWRLTGQSGACQFVKDGAELRYTGSGTCRVWLDMRDAGGTIGIGTAPGGTVEVMP